MLFIKSLLDNNYVKLHDTGMVASFGDGINSAPNILLITEIGRKFMDDFIKSDIGYTLIK